MKTIIPISKARQKLPSIIKSLKKSPDIIYQVTVHGEVVAEIKSPAVINAGDAAARLLTLRRRVKKGAGPTVAVSENIKDHLYGAEDRA
jgi:antitoxin (DNA-binding transcriptional repressor) of toxin-antitoxin stability system